MSKNKAKIYNFNGESFISNMDMSPEEVEEMAQFFDDVYGKSEDYSFDLKLDLDKDEDVFEAITSLEHELESEKNKLIQAGILKKTNIGHLASILEGQEYIDDLYHLMILYIKIYGFKRAINIGEEILRLDSLYMLHLHAIVVSLYAYFEDDVKINKVCKKCNRPCIIYFISMMIVYYKKGNFSKAKEYLELIEQTNSAFGPYFKGKKVKGEEANVVISMVKEFNYLFDTAPYIEEFIAKKGKVRL